MISGAAGVVCSCFCVPRHAAAGRVGLPLRQVGEEPTLFVLCPVVTYFWRR